MKVEHKHLDEMYRAYAAATFPIDDEPAIFIASEEKDHPCYMYTGEHFETRTTVWESGGGCMSIIPIPSKKNEFLAIMDFYLKESPSSAKLVWGKYNNGKWSIKDVLYLPYLHRFDIYPINGINYFVGATIADSKEFKDDWSVGGSIYMGVIPDDPSQGIDIRKIKSGMFRNHGYYKRVEKGVIKGYFASDEGVFELDPTQDWSFTQIMNKAVGEIALHDINGDGKLEMITIEPFHGDTIKVYEMSGHDNEYKEVYKVPFKLDFAHTLVGDELNGVSSFVGGIRRVDNQLFTIQYQDGSYNLNIIDDGGPSNIAVGHTADRDYIVAANHTRNEAAVYFIDKK